MKILVNLIVEYMYMYMDNFSFSVCHQYLSNLDEMPAYMGGRDNLWRKLDLNGKLFNPLSMVHVISQSRVYGECISYPNQLYSTG